MKSDSLELCMRNLETRRRGGPDGYRAAVVKALSQPRTSAEIYKVTGVMPSTVGRWLRILRDEKAIHVGDWRRTVGQHGPIIPIYKLGNCPDVPKPERLSLSEYSKRYREKLAKAGANDRRNKRRRALYAAEKTSKTRDPLIAALFGAPTKAA